MTTMKLSNEFIEIKPEMVEREDAHYSYYNWLNEKINFLSNTKEGEFSNEDIRCSCAECDSICFFQLAVSEKHWNNLGIVDNPAVSKDEEGFINVYTSITKGENMAILRHVPGNWHTVLFTTALNNGYGCTTKKEGQQLSSQKYKIKKTGDKNMNYEITEKLKSAVFEMEELNNDDSAASTCYREINKNKDNVFAWILLSLIGFKKGEYMASGVALHNAICKSEGGAVESLFILLKLVERCEKYLGEELSFSMSDFLSGLLEDAEKNNAEKIIESENPVIDFLESDWDAQVCNKQ